MTGKISELNGVLIPHTKRHATEFDEFITAWLKENAIMPYPIHGWKFQFWQVELTSDEAKRLKKAWKQYLSK
jgi:hypothetical protein